MAVFGRSPQPRRPMPRYGRGWAIGSSTDVGVLWRHLVIAYAPFLGQMADPTKKLYGSRFRPGQASFSGGRAASSIWGPAWEHNTTSDSVTIADSNAQGLLGSGGSSSYTTILGYRKTDGTFRISAAYGYSSFGGVVAARVPTNNEHLIIRYNAGNGEPNLDVDLTGNTWQEDHVYAASAGPYGKLAYVDGRLVGTSTAPSAGLSEGGNLILGNGADGGQIGDLAVYGFFYLFSRQLPDEVVSALSADPGILFRPSPPALSKPGASFTAIASGLVGAGALAANLTTDIVMAANLPGSAALALSAGLISGVTASTSGAAAVVASMGSDALLNVDIQGAANLVLDLAGAPQALLPVSSGMGGEFFGDPFGGGGPLHVARSRSIKGQVVRVAFDAEPLAVSAAGINDGLNPSNYTVTVVEGQAARPLVVGVDPNVIVGPAAVTLAGEFALDIHVDRPLVVGLRYEVRVSPAVFGRAGGAMGAPYAGQFVGMVLKRVIPTIPRRTDLVDIRNAAFDGRFTLTTAGDLVNHGGLDSLRKRILRRLSTPVNAFSCLPGYGVGARNKDLTSIAQLQAMQSEARVQVLQEPEVVTADVSIQQDASHPEVVTIRVSVTTRTGLSLQVGAAFSASGGVVL